MKEVIERIQKELKNIKGIKNIEIGLKDFGHKNSRGVAYGQVPYLGIEYLSNEFEDLGFTAYVKFVENMRQHTDKDQLTVLYYNPDISFPGNKRNVIIYAKGDDAQKAKTWESLANALDNSVLWSKMCNNYKKSNNHKKDKQNNQ